MINTTCENDMLKSLNESVNKSYGSQCEDIVVKICTCGDSFQDGNRYQELANTFREMADKIENGMGCDFKIKDINGNTIGFIKDNGESVNESENGDEKRNDVDYCNDDVINSIFDKMEEDDFRRKYCKAHNIVHKTVKNIRCKNLGDNCFVISRNDKNISKNKELFMNGLLDAGFEHCEKDKSFDNPIYVAIYGNGTTYYTIDSKNKQFRISSMKEAWNMGANID